MRIKMPAVRIAQGKCDNMSNNLFQLVKMFFFVGGLLGKFDKKF